VKALDRIAVIVCIGEAGGTGVKRSKKEKIKIKIKKKKGRRKTNTKKKKKKKIVNVRASCNDTTILRGVWGVGIPLRRH
jgi:hypothetical protein